MLPPLPPPAGDPVMERFLDRLVEATGATWAELDLTLDGARCPVRYGRGTRRPGGRRLLLEIGGRFRAEVRHDGGDPPAGVQRLLTFALEHLLDGRELGARLDLVTRALDATSSAVLLFDGHGEIAYANPRAEELLVRQTLGEFRVETVRGREETLLDSLTRLAGSLKAGEPSPLLGHHRFPDGTTVAWELALLEGSGVDGGEAVLAVVRTSCAEERPELPKVLAAFNLTRREREVVEYLVCGKSTREIAEAMGISLHTVRDHLKHLYRKTGTRSRRQLLDLIASAREAAGVRLGNPGTGPAVS